MIAATMDTDPKEYYIMDWEDWWMEKWGWIILDWTLDMVKVTIQKKQIVYYSRKIWKRSNMGENRMSGKKFHTKVLKLFNM